MSRRTSRRPVARITSIVPLALASLAAAASPAGAQQSSDRTFTGAIGVAVVSIPEYAGSDEYRVLPVPVAELEYRGRVYIGGSKAGTAPGIGAHLVRNSRVTWDVGFSGEASRKEHRADALAGMGKRSAAGTAATGVALRLGFLMASAGASFGLDGDVGNQGSLSLATELPVARRLSVGVRTTASFADARNMAFDFGVTREQSDTRRALAEAGDARLRGIDLSSYSPDAGMKELRAGASLSYVLTQRSRLVLFGEAASLSDEAARSPLVRERNGIRSGVALGYGF